LDEGGETAFPKLDIKIKPVRGSTLFWLNVFPEDGRPNVNSEHASVPVQSDSKEKWAFALLFRD
jgi:prolyl 4-hydroxylase